MKLLSGHRGTGGDAKQKGDKKSVSASVLSTCNSTDPMMTKPTV